ncbi:hypothetical protein CLV24_104250 [Pontibacter ummariensis]|uniref:DUF4468 domain-containing protein n=1 Tax=Pontibacter ummariensis TaxID=1610492 RepID=A0A239DJT7_9BACT|nr:hypothetical protein [Pontibacter ummariensis]PRY14437.1 hypothetical protein CLV24_104250 [Pontibacter ummariensis]SNS31973.1 hypothetical protein SAMN06296052_104249 [Pontibacter ummariensis]
MKTLFTALLLSVCVGALAQESTSLYASTENGGQAVSPITTPQKQDNAIIIDTGLNGEEAFMQWGRYLAQNGFAIGDSNKDFLTFTTRPKDTSKLNYHYTITSSADEMGKIRLTMRWQKKSSDIVNAPASNFYDWEYSDKARSVQGLVFKDVMELVSSFGNYPISVSRL